MKRCLPLIVLMLAVLLPAASTGAWSYKEHILMTRLAVQRLLADEQTPAEMKAWLREICPEAANQESLEDFINQHVGPNPEGITGLSYWSIYPDMDRNRQVPLFGINEGKMHFIDLEFFHPDPQKQAYQHDLSAKPKFDDVPRDKTDRRYIDAGYLPLRVEQSYDELVRAIKDDRLRPMAGDLLNNASAWAGHLAHYLQDNTQPHHSTIDYRSATYFPGPDRAPNVHGMMEYGFLDDEELAYPELRQTYFELVTSSLQFLDDAGPDEATDLRAATTFDDPFVTSLKASLNAYDYLPLVGEAAQAAVKAGNAREPDLTVFANYRRGVGPSLIEAKAFQTALAVLHTEAALRQAWLEAHGEYHRPAGHRTPGVSQPVPTARPAR